MNTFSLTGDWGGRIDIPLNNVQSIGHGEYQLLKNFILITKKEFRKIKNSREMPVLKIDSTGYDTLEICRRFDRPYFLKEEIKGSSLYSGF